jgi:hypothetical protein
MPDLFPSISVRRPNLFGDCAVTAAVNALASAGIAERLIIVVQFPVTSGSRKANDVRAFLTEQAAGGIGVALGVLLKNVDGKACSPTLMQGEPTAEGIRLYHAQIRLLFNRDMAATNIDHEPAHTRPSLSRCL